MTEETRRSNNSRQLRHRAKAAQSELSYSSVDLSSGKGPFLLYWWPVILSILVSQVLYWDLLPTNLSSLSYAGDGGDFAAAVLTRGVPHPSGYPLYLIISDVFMLFGKSVPIWTLALISAISVGIMQRVLAYVLHRVLDHRKSSSRWIVAIIVFCLGVSTLVWSQAVIVEVYTLSNIFIALYFLWEVTADNVTKDKRLSTRWILLSWICGLFWGAHLTTAFVMPLVAYRLWKLLRAGGSLRRLLFAGIGWFSGIILYAIIPPRAAASPAINWGNAIDWKGLLWLITGGGYRPLVFSIRPIEYAARLSTLIRLGLGDFTLIGMVLIIFALVYKRSKIKLLPQCGFLMAAYTLFSVGYSTNDSFVYLIPVWIAASVILAQELSLSQTTTLLKTPVFPWLMAGILLMTAAQIPGRMQLVDPRKYEISVEAESMLTKAAPNSTLYPDGDSLTFALWYYRYGLGIRPDVEVISPGLQQYDWYSHP